MSDLILANEPAIRLLVFVSVLSVMAVGELLARWLQQTNRQQVKDCCWH